MSAEDLASLVAVNAAKIKSLQQTLELHVRYQQDAVGKANTELRERLAGMNEFRDTLRDQAARFITREEVELKLEPVVRVENIVSNWQGRIWALGLIASVMGGLAGGVIGAVASWIVK